MMTNDLRLHPDADACARFEAQLGAYLERDLDGTRRSWMEWHRAGCERCDALVNELEALVADAAALPSMHPSRDLWADIAPRLEAPVIPLRAGVAHAASTLPTSTASPAAGRTATSPAGPMTGSMSVRRFAVAATLLVAVSSGVTWQLARSRAASGGSTASPSAAPATTVATAPSAPTTGASATVAPTTPGDRETTPDRAVTAPRGSARLVARGDDALDLADGSVTYEREITALRRIVDERFTELDTATVTELRRNLGIIDKAISDSRAALARDPRSAVVSTQLDRALQAKLELLRRVALL